MSAQINATQGKTFLLDYIKMNSFMEEFQLFS